MNFLTFKIIILFGLIIILTLLLFSFIIFFNLYFSFLSFPFFFFLFLKFLSIILLFFFHLTNHPYLSDSELPNSENKSSTQPSRFTVSSSSSNLKIRNTLSSRALPRPSHAPPPLHSESPDLYEPYDDDDGDDDDDVDDDDADDAGNDDADDHNDYDGESNVKNADGRESTASNFGEVGGSEAPPRTPGTPSEPRDLEAVIVTTRFVTLRWKEPEEKNGDIETYSVFYRQDGSQR